MTLGTPKPIKIPSVRCPDCKLPFRGGDGEGSFVEHKKAGCTPETKRARTVSRGRGKS